MNNVEPSLNLKYRPSGASIASLLTLVAVCTLLFMGRTRPGLQLEIALLIIPEFYSHISNFVITVEIVLLIAFVWLLRGVSTASFIWLFAIAIGLNLFIELFIGILNTPDIVDALFGIFGVLVSAIWTILLKQFGLTNIGEDNIPT